MTPAAEEDLHDAPEPADPPAPETVESLREVLQILSGTTSAEQRAHLAELTALSAPAVLEIGDLAGRGVRRPPVRAEDVFDPLPPVPGMRAAAHVRTLGCLDQAVEINRFQSMDDDVNRLDAVIHTVTISPTYRRKRMHERGRDTDWDAVQDIVDGAEEESIEPIVRITACFGNPWDDPWSPDLVLEAVRNALDHGARSLMLTDAGGEGEPETIAQVLSAVDDLLADQPPVILGAHLHRGRGGLPEKVDAALEAEVDRICCAPAGLGGNVPTGRLLERMVAHGFTCTRDAAAVAAAEEEALRLGRKGGE